MELKGQPLISIKVELSAKIYSGNDPLIQNSIHVD